MRDLHLDGAMALFDIVLGLRDHAIAARATETAAAINGYF